MALVAVLGVSAAAGLTAGRMLLGGFPSSVTDSNRAGDGAGYATSLDDLSSSLRDCRSRPIKPQEAARSSAAGCRSLTFVWSRLMPLSTRGIDEAARAAKALGLGFWLVADTDLMDLDRLPSRSSELGHAAIREATVDDLLAAGATAHYPAVVLHADGVRLGGAILGYKTAAAYRVLISRRLRDVDPERGFSAPGTQWMVERSPNEMASRRQVLPTPMPTSVDYPVSGSPGAYFRALPGKGIIVFEAGRQTYFLNLADGVSWRGPKGIDFIPTPDGRLFVSPGVDQPGLRFFAAEELLAVARERTPRETDPIFFDRQMRDQYPSIGVLEERLETARRVTLYRVLTSWFDRAVFRDYEASTHDEADELQFQPLTNPVPVCDGTELSIPILAPNGRRLSARDERTSTTKIFELEDDGGCTVLTDLGLQTGKVAWYRDSDRIAFAIPGGALDETPDSEGETVSNTDLRGIYVYHLQDHRITRVPHSRGANRLKFPEFVGTDSLAFLLSGDPSRFRIVCCVR